MNKIELRGRVLRFIGGDRRVSDLDRIFLALRDHSYGNSSVKEIGDFVAHRSERDKGPVTAKVRDIHLSFVSWLKLGEGIVPTLEVAKRITAANLRTATDEQLKARIGLSRQIVGSKLIQSIKKMERNQFDKLTAIEIKVFDYLAGAFVWNPAFTDVIVAKELINSLTKNGILKSYEVVAFNSYRPFLSMYVVSLMHGCSIKMEDGSQFQLYAGFDNSERNIEVRAHLNIEGFAKPVTATVCIFWTNIKASDFCTPELLSSPNRWPSAIEIDNEFKLAPLAAD